uniref:Uncharacterized protein n=1 Tax=Physcomitrium patens TaxID=3218 RepID=A0A2K1J3S5_PHYPA|nr:hypothetical protein PHYPA_022023 [Physcomitrium patens]
MEPTMSTSDAGGRSRERASEKAEYYTAMAPSINPWGHNPSLILTKTLSSPVSSNHPFPAPASLSTTFKPPKASKSHTPTPKNNSSQRSLHGSQPSHTKAPNWVWGHHA